MFHIRSWKVSDAVCVSLFVCECLGWLFFLVWFCRNLPIFCKIVCLRVYLASLSPHSALKFLIELSSHYFNWPPNVLIFFLFNYFLLNSTCPSAQIYPALALDFTKALYYNNVLLASHSGVGAFRQSPLLDYCAIKTCLFGSLGYGLFFSWPFSCTFLLQILMMKIISWRSIASLTPLLSWLKGSARDIPKQPPAKKNCRNLQSNDTNSISIRQKKSCWRFQIHVFYAWKH